MDIDQLRQPSTWTGIVTLGASVLGITLGSETAAVLSQLIGAAAGLYLIVIREARK